MDKIDRRRNYVIVTDTETANTLTTAQGKLDMSCVLAYDCGWVVADTRGNIYRARSFINSDIFYDEAELMQTAFPAISKILQAENVLLLIPTQYVK